MSLPDGAPRGDRRIFHEIASLQRLGRPAALASPVRITGSAPCANQSRLLVREDGPFFGTIGGGLLEAEVLRRAPEVIASGRACVLEFELRQDEAAGAGMICGGACEVLIEPILHDTAIDVFAAAAQAEIEGRRTIFITALGDQGCFHKLALLSNGTLVGSTGDADKDAALRDLAEGHGDGDAPALLEAPFRVAIQPMCSLPPLYIFGAGHVAVPVANLSELVGFRTIIIDDRGEFANVQRFPQADRVLVATVDEAFDELPINEGAYVVSITRGHQLDEEVVAHALRTCARYVGMIGSKRKVGAICQRLRDSGFSDADIARLHAPVGVDIGAETVEEIALSIVAELVAVRRGRCPDS